MANDYYKQADKKLEEDKTRINEQAQKEKDDLTADRNKNVEQATRTTEEQKKEADDSYLDILRSAGIQKALDLRDIQETRANMGLSRSGLSATEQTAAILSAGNKVGNAQIARQKTIDTLEQSLKDYINDQDAQERKGHLAIDKSVESTIQDLSKDYYKTATDAYSADYQAKVDANAKTNTAIINAQKDAEDKRLDTLWKAYSAGKITSDSVYVLADENGWTAAQAIKYSPYIDTVKNAVDNGGAFVIKNEKGETVKTYDSRVDYFCYTDLSISDLDYLSKALGITKDEVEAIKKKRSQLS